MRNIIFKTALVGVLAMGMTACTNDLNISSNDPQSSATYDDTALLAKLYASMGLTGQKGAAGNGDLSDDEGESGFYRTTFNLQELCTDECVWAWQTDTDIPQITNIAWNSSSKRNQWAYTRLGYNITLFNFYLSETDGRTDGDYPKYRAEARFLRALHYWYFLDLWHKAPFKLSFDINELPVEKAGKDLYDWLDQELTEIEGELATVGEFNSTTNFGRADQGAAWMLHARLALNSEVYTDGQTKDYDKAISYCDKLISCGKYALASTPKGEASGYEQVFMADNDQNTVAMREIILPIRQDGVKARCYSGANYLVSSMRKAGMPYMGTSNGWSCNFSRAALVKKFFPTLENCPLSTAEAPDGATEEEIIALDKQDGSSTRQIIAAAGDDRALFYGGRGGGVKKRQTDKITGFTDGLSIVKWQNIRSDSAAVSDKEFPDTDIPLLRFAEAYLTRAEAMYRKSGNLSDALADINVLRNRANATPLVKISSEMDILDEWCREFYMEGRRRSDLVRFGCFTGKNYIWDWKGGKAEGTTVDSHFNVYPIPADDVNNNANMSQNKGY